MIFVNAHITNIVDKMMSSNLFAPSPRASCVCDVKVGRMKSNPENRPSLFVRFGKKALMARTLDITYIESSKLYISSAKQILLIFRAGYELVLNDQ